MSESAPVRVIVAGALVEAPPLEPGDLLVAVHSTGDLLVISAEDYEVARSAVERAHNAFVQMATVTDDQITQFFRSFGDRLADDAVWERVAAANEKDVARAREAGRSTTRLVATERMREGMIDGLYGWAKAPSRAGEVLESREGPDWVVERRRAPLGVVAFVFEGRPNVFADGVGVLRGRNTSVMRIGRDALGTAAAIEAHAVAPSLDAAGLPDAAVTLIRSPAHGAGQALFTQPAVRLAVARGSGPTTALLGAVARQHGIPASLHGTGGAWMYLADDADGEVARSAVEASVDRKVCNTLNTIVVSRRRAHQMVPLVIATLQSLDAGFRLHVAAGSELDVPPELLSKQVAVRRAEGEVVEPQVDVIPPGELSREWEWEATVEVSMVCADSDEEAVGLINAHSPRFVASIITSDPGRFERFYERVDAPYVGDGFTRWVDGQWAWDRPELGLSNWESGRILGRSGILSGEDVFTVRDVFRDRSGRAGQRR